MDSPETDLLVEWKNAVRNYCRQHLSAEEDKLLAIGALAESFSLSLGSEYLADLWRNHLIYELLWASGENGHRSDR